MKINQINKLINEELSSVAEQRRSQHEEKVHPIG
jgi:hypothetical protein